MHEAGNVIVDEIDRHMKAKVFSIGLTRTAAAIPMGFYLGWAVHRGLISDKLRVEHAVEVAACHNRLLTGPQVIARIAGALHSSFLSEEVASFTVRYYSKAGRFFTDYAHAFKRDVAVARSLYAVKDSWENQQKMIKILDARLSAWRVYPPAAERIFGEEVGLGSYHALEAVAQEALRIAATSLATARKFQPFIVLLTPSDDLHLPRMLTHQGRTIEVISDDGLVSSAACLVEGLTRRSVQAFATVSASPIASANSDGMIMVRAHHLKSGPHIILATYTSDDSGATVLGRPEKG